MRRSSRRRRARRVAAGLGTLLTALLVSAMIPSIAAAAKSITLTLSPATIVADGQSTTTATATVTDAKGNPVAGDQVTIAASSGQSESGITDLNGTYSATITSTTTAGTSTITATDTTPNPDVSTTAQLTQVAGPAAHIVVQLSPPSIVADGSSTSTATATVTDAFNNPVPGATIGFSASDAGIGFGPVAATGDGSYTTTLTSSTTPGITTIVATDSATAVKGIATLTLATSPSVVTLSVVPAAPLTNRLVTLVAIVTATAGRSVPSGTVTLTSNGRSIAGCDSQPTVAQVVQRLSESTCQVAFAASTSPEDLEATFTSGSPNVADSSATATLSVGRAGTSTTLDVSNPTIGVGSTATFIAQVAASEPGPTVPSGSVDFFDGGQPIAACSNVPLVSAGRSSTATCAVMYGRSGPHNITARYEGDANFTGSTSSPAQPVSVHTLPPLVRGTVKALMQWTFYYTPKYTTIVALVVKRAPVGANVAVSCRGRGCPYAKRVNSVREVSACQPSGSHKCLTQQPGTVDLQPGFKRSRLTAGAQVIVQITRANWIGKYYLFTVRAGHPPAIRISCLAPGGTRPGIGC
jgi:hypothetical protein